MDYITQFRTFYFPDPGTITWRDYLWRSFIVGIFFTTVSWLVVKLFGVDASMTPLEIAAVSTSFACTYLCNLQSRMNYPLGVITTALYAWLTYDAGLLGSAALNAYLVPVLAYGWFRWGHDKATRPVAHISIKYIPVYLIITAAVWAFCTWVVTALGGQLGPWDTAILVLSVLAQLLLDNKKMETWIIWILVNVVAIYVYSTQGLWLVTAQYVFFLINTGIGWMEWHRIYAKNKANEIMQRTLHEGWTPNYMKGDLHDFQSKGRGLRSVPKGPPDIRDWDDSDYRG